MAYRYFCIAASNPGSAGFGGWRLTGVNWLYTFGRPDFGGAGSSGVK